jgi:hypothetical protein
MGVVLTDFVHGWKIMGKNIKLLQKGLPRYRQAASGAFQFPMHAAFPCCPFSVLSFQKQHVSSLKLPYLFVYAAIDNVLLSMSIASAHLVGTWHCTLRSLSAAGTDTSLVQCMG